MTRNAAHPIEPLFVDRWSPRSFTGEPVPDAVLLSAFEAARWAPSASNVQPWRFLLARPGDADWETFVGLLMPRNALWASRASALVVILSELRLERRGVVVDNVSHSFDAGAAWTNFAHQALLLGWHTHGIGGFDREAARTRLAVPDDFAIEAMVARHWPERIAPDDLGEADLWHQCQTARAALLSALGFQAGEL